MAAKTKVTMISGSYKGMRCGVGEYVCRLVEELKKNLSLQLTVLTYPQISNWSLFSFGNIFSHIKRSAPDIIHIHYPTIKYNRPYHMAIVFLPLFIKLLFPKIRIVTSIHDFSIGRLPTRLKTFLLLAASDAIIVSNERDKAGIARLYPFLKKRLKKIYLGSAIDLVGMTEAQKTELKKELSPDGSRIIAYFGFLTRTKNIELLIKSFSRLNKKTGNYRLMIIGMPQNPKDRAYLLSLMEKTDKLDASGRISWFVGLDNKEVSRYLQCADVCVLPFERGADLRRSSLITAVTHAIPVISTINKKFLIDKELEDMGAARLVSLSTEALYSAMEDIFADSEKRDLMISRARKIKDKFSWDSVSGDHYNLYRGLV